MRRLALCLTLLAVWAAPAPGATGTVTMDDGVQLAYDLVEPAGSAPADGWPAVVVMHGLGGSKDTVAPVARYFAGKGYAALAFSVRGQGTSQGDFGLAGPRDVADMRAMVAWLTGRPEVSDARIGCWGISLGGGECWNATPTGIFKAVTPVATWTNLLTALWPGGVARSGVVATLAATAAPRSTLIQRLRDAAVQSTQMDAIAALAVERSVAPRLGAISTPVYLFQGRVDWAFDIDQATAAFARLRGPKKLYVGAFGHPPSTFSTPDFPAYVLAQSAAWFDRYVKGARNGIERPAVTLADRTGRKRTSFPGLPPTRATTYAIGSRAVPLPRPVETFGQSVVRVRVRSLSGYPRLVAVLLANGKVVTHGAVVPKVGLNTIRLADYAVSLPKGARLQVRLGPDGGAADLAYLGFGATGTILLGETTLTLRTLR